MRLKLAAVRAFVAQLIVEVRGAVRRRRRSSRAVAEIVDVWAARRGLVDGCADADHVPQAAYRAVAALGRDSCSPSISTIASDACIS